MQQLPVILYFYLCKTRAGKSHDYRIKTSSLSKAGRFH